MTKCFKKCLSLLLAIVLCMGTTITAFAAEERDPYTIEGHYVEELVQLNEEELANLPLEQAETLFEEAFAVPADNYTEDEIRLGLDGLSFCLLYTSPSPRDRQNLVCRLLLEKKHLLLEQKAGRMLRSGHA